MNTIKSFSELIVLIQAGLVTDKKYEPEKLESENLVIMESCGMTDYGRGVKLRKYDR